MAPVAAGGVDEGATEVTGLDFNPGTKAGKAALKATPLKE